MAKKRTCTICGKEYEYCGHCPNKNVIEPWRNLYCSENCRDAFAIMGQYKVKKMDADEAKSKLEGFGLSPEKVRKIHKPIVVDIFKSAKKPDPELEIKTEESQVQKISEEKPLFHKNFKKKPRKFEEKNIVKED